VVPEVVVVDALDRDLEHLLTACNMRVVEVPTAHLAALAHPAAHQPDVVLLDLRGAKKVPAAVTAFKQQHPSTGVVVVASTADPALMLEAMRAGVNEFVTEPITQYELEAAVTRLVGFRKPAVAGDVFAFLGAKGGVGTTTAAVNVATALARLAPGKTLLIDLHLAHGDTALFLGAEPRFSVVDALENTHRFDEAFFRGLVTATRSGVDLLASSDRALVSSSAAQQVHLLAEFAARLYRYIVLDVPRSDAATLDALDAATGIVVVANQELPTVRSASRIAAALRQRYGKDKVRVIVSRYDKNADIGHDDVERVVGSKVRHLVPSDYRVALQALNKGRPLALDNHNKLATAYRQLASELAGVVVDAGQAGEPGGFLSIFGRRS
jgi:pilus assembly protein CpaE